MCVLQESTAPNEYLFLVMICIYCTQHLLHTYCIVVGSKENKIFLGAVLCAGKFLYLFIQFIQFAQWMKKIMVISIIHCIDSDLVPWLSYTSLRRFECVHDSIDLSALNNEHTCFSWNLIAVSSSTIGSGLEVYACNWQWIAWMPGSVFVMKSF